MSLSRPRAMTPASLAASRANGAKGKGPRSVRGKHHSFMNALKHGRYSRNLLKNLDIAGRKDDLELLKHIRECVSYFLSPVTRGQQRETQKLARDIWGWVSEQEKMFEAKRRSLIGTMPWWIAQPSRLRVRDGLGRTVISVTVGYQGRWREAGGGMVRVPLTICAGLGAYLSGRSIARNPAAPPPTVRKRSASPATSKKTGHLAPATPEELRPSGPQAAGQPSPDQFSSDPQTPGARLEPMPSLQPEGVPSAGDTTAARAKASAGGTLCAGATPSDRGVPFATPALSAGRTLSAPIGSRQKPGFRALIKTLAEKAATLMPGKEPLEGSGRA
jgi:hypothetical protein